MAEVLSRTSLAKILNFCYREISASASRSLSFWVEPFEFSAGVVDLELPVDAPLLGVCSVRPRVNSGLQNFQVADTAAA